MIVFAALTWSFLGSGWWVGKGIIPAQVEKGHASYRGGVQHGHSSEQRLGYSTTRSCSRCKESAQGLPPVAFESAGANLQLQQEKGALQVTSCHLTSWERTPSFLRENILAYLLPPSPAYFFVLAP